MANSTSTPEPELRRSNWQYPELLNGWVSPPPNMLLTSNCPRCAAPMEWRHSSLQCPECRYKEGCCSGE